MISSRFGIRPWEWDLLAPAEWHQYLNALEAEAAEAERAARKQR